MRALSEDLLVHDHQSAAAQRRGYTTVHFTVWLDRTVGRVVYRLHRRLYRLTGGPAGHRSPLGPILLLTTHGHRSGYPRTVPLLYFVDGGRHLVMGSNGGRPGRPGWLYNVRANANVGVQVGRRRFAGEDRQLTEGERDEVWPRLTTSYPGWAHYQTITDRVIEVVALAPRE